MEPQHHTSYVQNRHSTMQNQGFNAGLPH